MDIHFNESANQNAPISFFAQILKYLPQDWILEEDKRLSPRCNARKFTLWDQIVSLLFCHLAGCDSLREIEDGLISAVGKLQHLSAKAMGRRPKDLVAYCGLVPRNLTTGHHQKTAGITKRGDRLMRRNVVLAANCLYRMNKHGNLPNWKLKRWMDKKFLIMPYQKFIIQLAAKLLRIAYPVMKYGTGFDYARAGVARSAIKM